MGGLGVLWAWVGWGVVCLLMGMGGLVEWVDGWTSGMGGWVDGWVCKS